MTGPVDTLAPTPAVVPVEIVSRWDRTTVLFRAEVDASVPLLGRIKAAVELAVRARANLTGAYLADANLTGAYLADAYLADANLTGAYLADANLTGAKIKLTDGTEVLLATRRAILTIGPIGSENGTLVIYRAEDGALYAQRGCFGPAPLAAFAGAVQGKHGDGPHGVEYRAAIAMVEAWGAAA